MARERPCEHAFAPAVRYDSGRTGVLVKGLAVRTSIYAPRWVVLATISYLLFGWGGMVISSERVTAWWGSDGPLSGKAVLLAVSTSIAAGIAAASAYESLSSRRLRALRSGLLFEASSQISSARAGIISELLAAANQQEEPWSFNDEYALNRLKLNYWESRAHIDAGRVATIHAAVKEIHQVIVSFPGLQDDFELVRTAHQAEWAIGQWREWLPAVPHLNQLSLAERRDFVYALNASADALFQMLLVVERHTARYRRHPKSLIDAEIYEGMLEERARSILD